MKKPQKPKQKKSYEQLGRMLENIYESGYIDSNQLYKTSFIKGAVTGIGGVVGATVIAALLLWILALLNYTPLRPFTEKIENTVKSQN